MGGVGVTFASGDREVVVELFNNGEAYALFADDATNNMTTRPVPTEGDGYRKFIDEVRTYIYGKSSALAAC